ncbi:MAG TPA: sensor histidine kinase [Treponema sp.]|nr:sensor histidine kinase [Treponema sp.]
MNRIIRHPDFRNRYHYSIKTEMIFIYIIISVFPILIMQKVFYNFSRYYLEQKINTLASNNLSYIKNNIESDLEYYREILYRIVTDDTIVQNEMRVNNGDDFEKESCSLKLRDLLASYADIRDEIADITFINKSFYSVFYDKKSLSAKNYVWDSWTISEKEQVYEAVHDSGRVMLLNTRRYYYNNEEKYLYTLGIRAWNVKTGEDLGILMLTINEKQLQDICNITNGKKQNVREYSFIVDREGTIVSFRNKKYIGTMLGKTADGYDIDTILPAVPLNKQDGVIVDTAAISNTGWCILNLIDKNSMFYETTMLWKITMGTTLLIITVCIVLIFLFSNRFSKSVNGIVEEIQKVKQGDFSAHIKLRGERELIFISREFNDMILRINTLISNLKKQSEYIYEISNKRREDELNAIVAQINPHFLYNTLDCINWMAIRRENYEVSEMISNLAQILRYSIRMPNEEVTVFEAVDWLKKYLYLHEVRFNNCFKSEFDVEDEVLNCRIYKLLLQPIVENAVIHGFKGFDSGRLLSVRIGIFQGSFIRIIIEDNGNGIPKEKVARLLSENKGNGIGIRNVYERLKIYYGDKAGMTISSEENTGTKVTIIIPRRN